MSTRGPLGYIGQTRHVLKNFALLGALLLVLGFGSGGFSLDLLVTGRKKPEK